MITATVRVGFCAGHRLLNYEGKCRHLHGHNYRVEVEVENCQEDVDEGGFVADFGEVKKIVKGWIDENWDHGLVLNSHDEIARILLENTLNNRIFVLDDENPTAENMTLLLARVLPPLLPKHLRIVSVSVEETEGCSAKVIA